MRKKKGFTLAELLIVVAIIAILVAIAIPVYNAQLEKAALRVDEANERILQSYIGVLINSGQLTSGDTTITIPGNQDFYYLCEDGTLVERVVGAAAPANAYKAQAADPENDMHVKDAYLYLYVFHNSAEIVWSKF